MKPSSKVVIASAVLAMPIGSASELAAQEQPTRVALPVSPDRNIQPVLLQRFDKWPQQTQIVGIDNGRPVYQNERGEQFQLDPVTGDMQFLTADRFALFTETTRRLRAGTPLQMVKFSPDKHTELVAVVGVDAAGHLIHQNSRGERFYLEPSTGDMVLVK